MKKILSIILLGAALSMAAVNPSSSTTIVVNGDTTTVQENGDTTVVNVAGETAAAVSEAINEALDDTVFVDEDNEYMSADSQVVREGMRLARVITSFTIAGVILITFLALLFYYMNRRRKYKMIEKAIENGYQLPPELLGGRAVQQQNIYVTPPAQPMSQPQRPQQASGAVPTGVPQHIPVDQPLTQWQTYRGGIVTSIVGFSLMLFFLAAGATPMVALMSIILFIGLAKVFFTYQEQRNITTIYHNATQQPQQPAQPQSQQPAPGQPAQPVQPTPPPFKQEAPTQEQPQSPEQPS